MVIYCIENSINGKRYIGQTKQSPLKRWTDHKYDLNSGNHDNPYLQYSWNKYGKDSFNFIILESNITTQKMLNNREIYYIQKYKSKNKKFGYNIREGGSFGNLSEDSKKKISNSLMGNKQLRSTQIKKSKSRRKQGYPIVVSPNGMEYNIDTMNEFCRLHGLKYTGMYDLVNGKKRTYKGWHLKGTDMTLPYEDYLSTRIRKTPYPALIAPTGKIYHNIINLSKFCREHSLVISNLHSVIQGRSNSHNGWKLYK